ncbi:Alpha-N-acetylgalactosaminidase [Halotydeus destructor]|nr:Alpha-N-acetylgalactosaminidase [Halotydeus destructor]
MKLLYIVVSLVIGQVSSLENGLARTPPMGWLAWNRFMCEVDCDQYPDSCINEQLFKDMADRMAADGWKDVGYEYVNIDDCWSEMQRDATGRLVANSTRFPNGIKGLADYVHSKGLKLGLYGDLGTYTCGGYPGLWTGSADQFEIDAQTLADWGVDSFKVDGCYMGDETKSFDWMFPAFGRALNKTGRPILYSCEWGLYQLMEGIQPNYAAVADSCNTFRPYYDTSDAWVKILDVVDFVADRQDKFAAIQRPGAFFDPDMVVIGNYGLSPSQARAHFALWAIMGAPLYMSNDLRRISDQDKAILQNKALIAVNQDPLAALGKRVKLDKNDGKNVEVWAKPLTDGGFAVAYFNMRTQGSPIYISYKLKEVAPNGTNFVRSYKVLDLYTGEKQCLDSKDDLKLLVEPSGGVSIVRFYPIN